MTMLKTTTQLLPGRLTREEVEQHAQQLADTWKEFGYEQELQKVAREQMKARLSEKQANLTHLSLLVSSGMDYRTVEVETRLLDDGQVQEVRLDTGEVIKTRPPYESERQLSLAPKEESKP